MMNNYKLFALKYCFCLIFLTVLTISAYPQTTKNVIVNEYNTEIVTSKTEENQNSSTSGSQIEVSETEKPPTAVREIPDDLSSRIDDLKIPKFPVEFKKSNFHEIEPVKDKSSDNNESDQPKVGRRAKWEIEGGSTEYGAEIGYANDIATWMSGPKPWDIRGHRHFLASVRYGRVLGTRGIVTFSYAIEFIPISLAIGNQTENKAFRTNPNVAPTKRTTNYGFAINPTSFRFIFFPKLRLRPFIFAGLGASYHIKPVPIESGTKWNMQFDFGIGGQYMLSKTKAVQFGYRYYHLSNVYLSNYNPGYNTNVFFVGYSVFKK